jgi:peptidoglycan/LPS O-acetylase OafA/YrhL
LIPRRADEPQPTAGRHAPLEGYRGVAALFIVVYTVYQYARAGTPARYPLEGTAWHPVLVGLDCFVGLMFVTSAFLLGLPFAEAALAGTRPVPARSFLYRWAVRVVPLYLVATLIVWAARNDRFPGDWRDLLEHLTFTQVFDRERIFYLIGPAWALAVEVQFLLVLVALGVAACALCRRTRHLRLRLAVLLSGVAALAVCGIAWKFAARYLLHRSPEDWPVWFSLPARLDVFAVGLLLAVVVAVSGDRANLGRGARSGLRAAAVAVLVAAFALRAPDPDPHLYFHSATAVGFGMLLAASALAPPEHAGRVLATLVPALLGLISYSLYLWHEPVLLFLAGQGLFPRPGSPDAFAHGVVILAGAGLVAAWLSYWIIEYPTGMLHRSRGPEDQPREYYEYRAQRLRRH